MHNFSKNEDILKKLGKLFAYVIWYPGEVRQATLELPTNWFDTKN